jgi:hypothetical protein
MDPPRWYYHRVSFDKFDLLKGEQNIELRWAKVQIRKGGNLIDLVDKVAEPGVLLSLRAA